MDRFFGGNPALVLLRLAILSLIVGVVLAALGFSPFELIDSLRRLVERIYDMGFAAVEKAFRYFLLGAVIVFPVWFIARLLKMLGRHQPPSEGDILLDDQPLESWSSKAFARKVAYLPQQLPQAEGMTVRELVAIGRYPWQGALGRFGVADREKVEEAIALVGLKPLAHRLVDSLSGGERQRAWIAMLVAQDSRCLLLDEPTSALDIAHQVDVLALVHRLSQQRGLTVIAVLHDINMAARYCDYLVALRGGEMIAQGTPSELMRSETLEHIYGIPMGILPHPAGAAPVSFVY